MKREYLDLDDEDTVVPPGGSVRVATFLTDAVRYENGEPHFVRASDGVDLSLHQPGYRSVSDAASKSRNFQDLDALRDAARSARRAWIQRITDSWKTQVAGSRGQNQTDPDEINQSALSERREPDNSSSLAEWREHAGRPDDDDHDIDAVRRRHQRRRDSAYEDHVRNLSEAWKTNPRAATAIEQQREKWLGK
jgi:hypothetical protein